MVWKIKTHWVYCMRAPILHTYTADFKTNIQYIPFSPEVEGRREEEENGSINSNTVHMGGYGFMP